MRREGDKLAVNEDMPLPFDLPAVAQGSQRCFSLLTDHLGRRPDDPGPSEAAPWYRRWVGPGPAAPEHYIDLVSASAGMLLFAVGWLCGT